MRKIVIATTSLLLLAGASGCARETTRDSLRGAGFGAAGGAVAGR